MLENFQQWYSSNSLPHALLLLGNNFEYKKQEVENFAKWLFCQNKSKHACGRCKSCQMFAANNHSDLFILYDSIKVEQIRRLIEWSNINPRFGKIKIAILNAEELNINSSNALLKSIEEPPSNTIFFLLANQQYFIPVTLVSRCKKFVLQGCDEPWSQIDNDIFQDLYAFCTSSETNYLDIGQKWSKLSTKQVLYSLWKIIANMIIANYQHKLTDNAFDQKLDEIINLKPKQIFWCWYDSLNNAISMINLGQNINGQLFYEDFLLGWNQGVTSYGRKFRR